MKTLRPRGRHRAFSLVEVTIALGVAGFCLLAIVGLLQSGLSSERSTVDQTLATGVVADIFDDLRATPVGTNTTSELKIDLAGSSGTPQIIFFSGAGYPTGPKGSAATSDSRFRAGVQVDPLTNGAGNQCHPSAHLCQLAGSSRFFLERVASETVRIGRARYRITQKLTQR